MVTTGATTTVAIADFFPGKRSAGSRSQDPARLPDLARNAAW